MKRLLILASVLAALSVGCADDGPNATDEPSGSSAEETQQQYDDQYADGAYESTVVEVTTEQTLPSTGGPR